MFFISQLLALHYQPRDAVYPSRPADLVREAGLTRREERILRRIARGDTNREVALHLGVHEKTIKNAVTGILQKLEARSRTEAAVWALRAGLLDRDVDESSTT